MLLRSSNHFQADRVFFSIVKKIVEICGKIARESLATLKKYHA